MFISMGHWFVWRPLACVTLSNLEPNGCSSWIFYCCPLSWGSCHFGSTVLAVSCVPADDRLGRCYGKSSQSPILEWDIGDLVSPSDFFSPHHQGRLSSTVPGSLPNAAASKGQEQLSLSCALRLLTLPPAWPAPLCCPGEVQGLLSCSDDLNTSIPSCFSWHGSKSTWGYLSHAQILHDRQVKGSALS